MSTYLPMCLEGEGDDMSKLFKRVIERQSVICRRLCVGNVLICATDRKQVEYVHCAVGLHVEVKYVHCAVGLHVEVKYVHCAVGLHVEVKYVHCTVGLHVEVSAKLQSEGRRRRRDKHQSPAGRAILVAS
jgi:hypothetical protein